jgi:hypothetical protein
MAAQHARNYAFFDAPGGLIFTIDRIMAQGSWSFMACLQNIMVAARAWASTHLPSSGIHAVSSLSAELWPGGQRDGRVR